MAVDHNGKVYVTDGSNGRVQKFAPVPQKTQTITFDPLPSKTYGDAPFTVSASASSGLEVSFTSDTPAVCTVTDGATPSTAQVTLIAAGTCTLTASQDGDDDYAAATPVSQSFTIAKAAQTLTFAEGTPTTAERASSATIEVSSTTPTSITLTAAPETVCTASSFEVSFVGVGECTLTASQAATANYNAGSKTHTVSVVRTLIGTNISGVSGSGSYGDSATLTATLKRAGSDPLSGKAVAFTVAGTDVGNAATNDSGVATLSGVSLTGKDAGDYEVTASFAGDDTDGLEASSSSGTLEVAKATQTIAFTSTVPTDAKVGNSYTVSATASPSGLTVAFSSTTESVCSVSGNTVSFTAAGSCTVTANQSGNDNYEAALQQTQNITVVPADSTGPIITPTVSGTLGGNGWYTSNVSVSWSVTDAESAVSSSSGCGSSTVSADTAGTTLTCSATSDGGENSESVTLKRDATRPTLAPTLSATQVLLNGSVTATPNASDSTSGIATQSCTAAPTNSVSSKNVSCTASDNAGNSASANVSYNVVYAFSGFSSPVDNNVPNKAKAGQAIPLKWHLTDASGAPVTTLSSVQLSAASLSCSFGTTPDAVEEYASGSSGLQNLGDGYYQFNWKTPKSYANSCKTLQLNLGDGLLRTAAFQFTK